MIWGLRFVPPQETDWKRYRLLGIQTDVVLTDIRMQKWTVWHLKHVRENMSKDMEFIILSGYSEFQYAQKAMQYNVKNYI